MGGSPCGERQYWAYVDSACCGASFRFRTRHDENDDPRMVLIFCLRTFCPRALRKERLNDVSLESSAHWVGRCGWGRSFDVGGSGALYMWFPPPHKRCVSGLRFFRKTFSKLFVLFTKLEFFLVNCVVLLVLRYACPMVPIY